MLFPPFFQYHKFNAKFCQNSDLFMYPPLYNIAITGLENLTPYAFVSEDTLHCFCRTCGCSVVVRVYEEGKEKMMAVNVRSVEGVRVGELKYKFFDGWGKGVGKEYRID